MRWIDEIDGELHVRWMWLPSWMGMNQTLVADLEAFVAEYTGPRTPAMLDELSDRVVRRLADRFSTFSGLEEWLMSLRVVKMKDGQ